MLDRTTMLEVFETLGLAIFETAGEGRLTLAEAAPAWLRNVSADFDSTGVDTPHEIQSDEIFPFLRGFLMVAGAFWDNQEPGPLLSDIWVQCNRDGNEIALRATALLVRNRRLLLIERLEEKFEERQSMLQRSREKGLDNERLERVARELSAANLEAERAVRGKSESLAGMSHDLRTPLNAMIGFSTLLLQGRAGALSEKQSGYVGHILVAAGHLLDLINDVLDLSKIKAGFLALRPEEFPFDEALQEVLATIVPLAQAKGVIVERTPNGHLVRADRVRFRQILYNLLSNAIRFTGADGTVAILATAAPDAAGWLEISVSDTGEGIPDGEREAIFERFYQIQDTGGKDGSGLGLAITRQLVEQHAGRIWVESAPGGGSRFVFTMPRT